MTWMSSLNHIMTAGFDAWLWLLRGLPDWLLLGMSALVIAFWLLLACRICRRWPIRIERKGRPGIRVVGLAPFELDPGAPQRSRWQQIRNTLRHGGLPLLPFLALCLPVALLVAQVESHFRWRAIAPGEPLIISATLSASQPASAAISKRSLELLLPVGMAHGAPALRVDQESTIYWRVQAKKAGVYPVRIRLDQNDVELDVIAIESGQALSPRHYLDGDWRAFAFPAAAALTNASELRSVTIGYPQRDEGFLGLCGASWWLLGMTFLFAFLMRRWLDLLP